MIVAYFFGPPCIFVQCKGVDALIYMKDGLCVHDVATSACLLKGGPKKWRFFCIPLLHTPELHQILTDLFHCLNQENICNNTVTKDPTTRHYPVKCQCLKSNNWKQDDFCNNTF